MTSHTIPENLETGEDICNSHSKDSTMDSYATDLCYVMASTSIPDTQPASSSVAPTGVYNGIYTGLTYYEYEVSTAIDYILEIMATAGKTDLAKRAKAANLDAIHDTVHEMARDEARHGKAFKGLLDRYFGK